MGGLLVIALMIGYVALTIWLLVKVKPLWGKATVLVAAILIPTADDMYYRRQLDAYCKNEAGFRGSSTIPSSAGIYFDAGGGDFYFEKLNLDLVEWSAGTGEKPYRLSRDAAQGLKKEQVNELRSRYESTLVETKSPPFLYQSYRLQEIRSKVVVSEVNNAAYYGGWFQRKLLGSLAPDGSTFVGDCGYEGKASPEFELLKKSLSVK